MQTILLATQGLMSRVKQGAWGQNAKGQAGGVNSTGKGQHGSVKGQKGTTGGGNSKGQGVNGGKNGPAGVKGQGVNKGSKGKGPGQIGGGDNGLNEQSINNNPFNTANREVITILKPECTENYSYV